MHVDWTALGLVLLISLAATGVLVTLVALGIAALGRRAVSSEHGTAVPTAAAALCFLGAAALIGFGLYLVILG